VIRAMLTLFIVGVLGLLAIENRHQLMALELPLGFRTGPLAVSSVILVSALAGTVLVAIALGPSWISASLRARRLRRELDAIEPPRSARNEPPPADGSP
jgi:uncharacterized integral membrane protein